MKNKYQWSERAADQINWWVHGHSIQELPGRCHETIVQFIHQWIPVNAHPSMQRLIRNTAHITRIVKRRSHISSSVPTKSPQINGLNVSRNSKSSSRNWKPILCYNNCIQQQSSIGGQQNNPISQNSEQPSIYHYFAVKPPSTGIKYWKANYPPNRTHYRIGTPLDQISKLMESRGQQKSTSIRVRIYTHCGWYDSITKINKVLNNNADNG